MLSLVSESTGSSPPFFLLLTIISSLRCIHTLTSSGSASPGLLQESDIEKAFSHATEAIVAKLRDPQAVYILETSSKASVDRPLRAIVRGVQLDFKTDLAKVWPLAIGGDGFDVNSLSCSYFFMKDQTSRKYGSKKYVFVTEY